MKKRQVSSSEYWDFFWDQFDMEEAVSGGYAEYDNVYRRTKEYVNNQIEIKKNRGIISPFFFCKNFSFILKNYDCYEWPNEWQKILCKA